MHACTTADAQSSSIYAVGKTMAEHTIMDEWPPDESFDYDAYYGMNFYYPGRSASAPNLYELPSTEMLPASQAQYSRQTPGLTLALPPQQLEEHQQIEFNEQLHRQRQFEIQQHTALQQELNFQHYVECQQLEQQFMQQQQMKGQQHFLEHQQIERQRHMQQMQPITQAICKSGDVAGPSQYYSDIPRGDNPREIRNKAEKQRRDKLNHSVSELAAMVPPVVASNKKIDKTGVLRLTAHYLRAHQYVFGDSIGQAEQQFHPAAALALLSLLNGFLLTTTYKGLIVVVSQNIQQYLGYAELDLLGQNVFNIVHQGDHQILTDNLMPGSHLLGPNGELLLPDEPEGKKKVADELASEKRRFIIRFKKQTPRTDPVQYVSCFVEGTLRKSDRAHRGYNKCCPVVRRARARGGNPCSSGNDVVFIGLVRPSPETFVTERNMEAFRMEYRTRHSIDGEIMESEQRISLVTGYMTHEVNGINAMNFMHRDDVRWVVFALREMYLQQSLTGESCYRLMTKNGQFIYLRTVGKLDVDQDSRAVRTFVCVNTVVDEKEGKQLIKMMKQKFMLNINDSNTMLPLNSDDANDFDVSEEINPNSNTVEDPRHLGKVILELITELPTLSEFRSEDQDGVCDGEASSSLPLAIIPPRKERILSSIDKIYTVIKALNRPAEMQPSIWPGRGNGPDKDRKDIACISSAPASPSKLYGNPTTLLRRQIDGREPLTEIVSPSRRSLNPISYSKVKVNHRVNFSSVYKYSLQEILPSETIMEVESEVSPTGGSPGAGIKRPSEDKVQGQKKINCKSDSAPAQVERSALTPDTDSNNETNNATEHFDCLSDSILTDNMLTSVIENIEDGSEPTFPELMDTDLEEILGRYEEDDSHANEEITPSGMFKPSNEYFI